MKRKNRKIKIQNLPKLSPRKLSPIKSVSKVQPKPLAKRTSPQKASKNYKKNVKNIKKRKLSPKKLASSTPNRKSPKKVEHKKASIRVASRSPSPIKKAQLKKVLHQKNQEVQ